MSKKSSNPVPPEHRLTIVWPAAQGLQLRKTITADGRVRDADNIRDVRHKSVDVSTPARLLRVVQRLAWRESGATAAVIRGEPACDRQPLHRQIAERGDRGDEGFIDTPRAWLALDADGIALPGDMDWRTDFDAVIAYALSLLPEYFDDVAVVWQLTGTHGLEIEARDGGKFWTGRYVAKLRLRFWVLLSRAINSETAEAWTKMMAGLLGLDPSISRTVQLNYVARPMMHDGTDPLKPFIDKGLAVTGIRHGRKDRVAVPDDIETEAKWSRAEGSRFSQCASHPSAEAAILAIGLPVGDDDRGAIRAHLWSAVSHLVGAQRERLKQLDAGAIAARVVQLVDEHKGQILLNLEQHGRRWGEVEAYLRSQLRQMAQWMIDNPQAAQSGDGGGKRKKIRRTKNPTPEKTDFVEVSVDEVRDIAVREIDAFVQRARDYWSAVEDVREANRVRARAENQARAERQKAAEEHEAKYGLGVLEDDAEDFFESDLEDACTPDMPDAPRAMLAVSTGSGKTEAAGKASVTMRPIGNRVPYFAVPHHKLGEELKGRLDDMAAREGRAIKVGIWRGMKQPDPLAPEFLMCRRPGDVELVERYKLSVRKTLCRAIVDGKRVECPFTDVCGYNRQRAELEDAGVVIVTHVMMTQAKPAGLPEPAVLFVDEASWQNMAAGTADLPVAVDLDYLRGASVLGGKLVDALDSEPDGPVRADAIRHLARDAEAARKAAFDGVPKLAQPVAALTGNDLGAALETQIGSVGGAKAAYKLARMWDNVTAADQLGPGQRSGRLELFNNRETGKRELRLRWKEPMTKSWAGVPIMHMDATGSAMVLGQAFGKVTETPRYVARGKHLTVRQVVDRALSHTAIAPKMGAEGVFLTDKLSVTAARNARKVLARLVEDAITSGYAGAGKILAIVPKATETVWRQGALPAWLDVIHHGATTGLDAWGDARACYVIGRMMPTADAVERIAGALTGVAVETMGFVSVDRTILTVEGDGIITKGWQHPDPLCEEIRWQITIAALIQAVGRLRGVNRTATSPADLVIWTDEALPEIGPVVAELWEAPSLEAEMLAAGCWFQSASDAERAWPEIISRRSLTRHRANNDEPNAKKDYPYKQLAHRSDYQYRLTGTRASPALAVFLNPTDPAEARAFLEDRLGPLALFEPVSPSDATAEPEAEAPQPDPWADVLEDFDVIEDEAPEPPSPPPKPHTVNIEAGPLYTLAARLRRRAAQASGQGAGQARTGEAGAGSTPKAGGLPGLGGGTYRPAGGGRLRGKDLRKPGFP